VSGVAVPDELCGDLLLVCSVGLTVLAREKGMVPSRTAARWLKELEAGAERHRAGLAAPAQPSTPVAPAQPAGEALTVLEMAQRMGCTPRYVRQLLAAGKLPGHKSGGVWIVHTARPLPDAEVPQGDP
jgi:excisionase family DNA binding protein